MKHRTRWLLLAGGAMLVALAVAVWLWQSTTSPLDARPTPASSATPTSTPNPLALAQQQLDAHLEQCTKAQSRAATIPNGCGISIPWGTEFTSIETVSFRIESLPVLELMNPDEASGEFVASDGILVATITGIGHDGATRTETYRTESWQLRGGITVADEGVTLTVW